MGCMCEERGTQAYQADFKAPGMQLDLKRKNKNMEHFTEWLRKWKRS